MKKKILSILMAMSIAVASAVPVLAMSMTEAVETVKSKVNVPAEYTEFDISHRTDNEENKTYSMRWTNEKNNTINVISDEEGHILDYDKYIKQDYDAFVTDNRDDITDKIVEQAKQLLPECFTETDTYRKYSEHLNKNGSGSVVLARYKDDVMVWDNKIDIGFVYDGENYEITNLMSNHDYKATFGENTTGDGLEEKYLALSDMKLQYNAAYVKQSDGNFERTPVLRYAIEDAPFINPQTGEAVKYVPYATEHFDYYGMGAGNSLKQEMADSVLTEKEISEIEAMEGIKTAEEIKAQLDKLSELDITDDMQIEHKSTYKDDNGYFINIMLQNKEEGEKSKHMVITVDAETGKLIYITNSALYHKTETVNTEMTDEELENISSTGKEFMEKHARGFTDFELSSRSGVKSENEAIISEVYTKTVNDIPFTECTAFVEYNTETNQIYSMSVDFVDHKYDGKFPDPSKAITKEEAYKTLLGVYPLTPVFVYDGEMYQKAYTIVEKHTYVDAIANKVVDSWDNEPVKINDGYYEYTDISGHWAEDIINLLGQYGYGIEDEEFKPDTPITAGEFVKLIRGRSYDAKPLTAEYAKRLGQNENEINENELVNRAKAVRFIVTEAGYSKVAELKDIFTVKFKDVADIPNEDLGYCAIAAGLGIVKGDGENFFPQRSVTRAEAAVMLYNYLSR